MLVLSIFQQALAHYKHCGTAGGSSNGKQYVQLCFLGVTGPRSTHSCFFKCHRFAPHVTLSSNQYKTDLDNKMTESLNQSKNWWIQKKSKEFETQLTVYWVSCIRDEIYIWSQIGDQTKMGKLGKLGTLTSQSPPTLGSSRPSAWSSTWSSHWNRQSNQKKRWTGFALVSIRYMWCSLTFRTKSTPFIPIVGFPIRETSDTGEIRIYGKSY